MNVSEYAVKIVGISSLPSALNTEQRLRIMTEVAVYETTYKDNQDGTHNVVYKTKITDAIDVEQAGKVIKGKLKGSESNKTRHCIWELQQDKEKMDIDEEVFYTEMQKLLRRNLPEIYEKYKHELNF